MLLDRFQDLLEGGGELFRAEAELAGKRVRRASVGLAGLGLGVLIAVSGIAVVMAGVTIRLAELWGWPLALAAVGLVQVAAGCGVWLVSSARLNKRDVLEEAEAKLGGEGEADQNTPRDDAEEAKERMKDAVTPGSTGQSGAAESPTEGLEHLKASAIEFAAKNPVVTGSAALLVVSLFGPRKTIRLVSRGVAAAGLAASALDAFAKQSGDEGASETTDSSAPENTGTKVQHRRPGPRPNGNRPRPMMPPRRKP